MISEILDMDTQRNTRYYVDSTDISSSECSYNSRSPTTANSPGGGSTCDYQMLNISSEPIISGNTFTGANFYCTMPNPNEIKAEKYSCELVVIEQPTEKFRFRYKSEMHGTHGSLMGERSEKSKKSFPKVELRGYNGKAVIRCSLYQTDTTNPSPHSHKLVVRKDDRDESDPHDLNVSPELGFTASFQGMGIIHTAKKDIAIELREKKKRLIKFEQGKETFSLREEQQLKEQADKEAKSMNLNQVRLCFEAFKINPDRSWSKLCEPIFSRAINNMKSALTGELKISRLSAAVSSAAGGEDLFLLVEKVGKKNIKVRFFEVDEDEYLLWEDWGLFCEADVHHQYAIALRTPPYKNKDIDKQVDVFIQLVRPSDQDTSEPVPFKYKPRHTLATRKRRRISCTSSLSSFELPESVAKEMRPAPSEDGHLSISEEFDKTAQIEELLNTTVEAQQQYFGTFIEFVKKDSDELKNLMDTTFWESNSQLNSLELGKLETDGVANKMSLNQRQKHLQALLYDAKSSSENKHLKRIYQTVIEFHKRRINKEECRKIILDIWNEYIGSNSSDDDLLNWIIAQGNYADAIKLFKIIESLQLYDILSNQNQRGETSLHTACLYSRVEMIRPLISFGCDPNVQDAKGNTALHIAVIENLLQCVLCLIKEGDLHINLTNDDGLTPLHLAIRTGSLQMVKTLVEQGKASAKVTISKNGNNALHLAVEQKSKDIVEFLLNSTDVKVDEANSSGFTPLDLARSINSKSEIVQLLMRKSSKGGIKLENLTQQIKKIDEKSDDDSESEDGENLQIDEDDKADAVVQFSDKSIKVMASILNENDYWKELAKVLDFEAFICLWSSAESLLNHLSQSSKISRNELLVGLGKVQSSLVDKCKELLRPI